MLLYVKKFPSHIQPGVKGWHLLVIRGPSVWSFCLHGFPRPNCVLLFFFFALFIFNRFFELFEKFGGYKTGKLKLKKPKQLQVSEVANNPLRLFPHASSDLFALWAAYDGILFKNNEVLLAGTHISIIIITDHKPLTSCLNIYV